MPLIVTFVAPPGQTIAADTLSVAREAAGVDGPLQWLAPERAVDCALPDAAPTEAAAIRARLAEALSGIPVDWAVQPAATRRKRLLLADMDSTIIGQECIDEVAGFAGVGDAVAAITRRAMAGELDFESSLRERVALLAGLDESALARAFVERVTVNDGAATLVATMRAHGARTILVSGGFTFFASRVARQVGFDDYRANVLISDSGRLSGRVAEPILGREAKRDTLEAACRALGQGTEYAIGIGDGANDLALIEAAGLGVAYHAKPVLARAADARIDHGDLTAALYFQGYAESEFASR